ncbi:MAG: hypothetical protein ACIAQZ_11365 [Sedimentisphaeraceae bacterium JB056]
MKDKNTSRMLLVLVCILGYAFLSSADDEKLIIKESDGSRAMPVHLIEIYDEEGVKILPDDDPLMPFSTSQTCGQCHEYEKISHGMHFNSTDEGAYSGRSGEPWIYFDKSLYTQIPLSYRDWPGVFDPEDIGMTTWQFTKRFGIQTPGGGAGEVESDKPEEIMRQFVSGNLEANCLACHNAHPGQDQKEYAIQVARENNRWAAAGASELASVSGSAAKMPDTYDPYMPDMLDDGLKPPTVEYRDGVFDSKDRILFEILGEVQDERCYFCHSDIEDAEDVHEWANDEDVHMASGLNCVDCHRNGVDHNMVRGYENEASGNILAGEMTCKQCHESGRLGSPEAQHKGLPVVHFEKLSCTACHSGIKPEEETTRIKTSKAHQLGIVHSDKDRSGPTIISPVYAEAEDGKIAPHNILWPSYWAIVNGEDIKPVSIDDLQKIVKPALKGYESDKGLSEEMIAEVIKNLQSSLNAEKCGYVSGGLLYSLEGENLSSVEHEAAKPYKWAVAHDVRAVENSLGAKNCKECHNPESAFIFGKVEVQSMVASDTGRFKFMHEFENIDPLYNKLFASSFVFRPYLKAVLTISALLVFMIIILYGLKGLNFLTKIFGNKSDRA